MIRKILQWPDGALIQPCVPVMQITDDVRKLVGDMQETMAKYAGIGLSAIQVGEPVRIMVLSPATGTPYQTLINPEIVAFDSAYESIISTEACLSIAAGQAEFNVIRKAVIAVRFVTLMGEATGFKCKKALSRVIQHEIDHMNGRLLVHTGDPIDRQIAGHA